MIDLKLSLEFLNTVNLDRLIFTDWFDVYFI